MISLSKSKAVTVDNPWDSKYLVPNRLSESVSESDQIKIRAQYCRALIFAGNTLYLWNQAANLKKQLLRACHLHKDHSVLLVGTFLNGSGLGPAVRSVVGESNLTLIDLSQKAIENLQVMPKAQLQWQLNVFDSLADKTFDRVILFSTASHIQNWVDCAEQINRILKDQGRLIIAEDPIGGNEFFKASHEDIKLEALITRLLDGLGLHENELPNVNTEYLTRLFNEYLTWSVYSSQNGLYVFYGQKGANDQNANRGLVTSDAIESFLAKKPFLNPWELLRPHEITAWGAIIKDAAAHSLAQGLFLNGWLSLAYDLNRDIVESMNAKLKVNTGARILAFGCLSRELEPAINILRSFAESKKLTQFDIPAFAGESLQKAMSNYLDSCEKNYFDVIWLPQVISYLNKNLIIKLLKLLKKEGQIVIIDACIEDKEWTFRLKENGLLKCIIVKTKLPKLSTHNKLDVFKDNLVTKYEIKKKGVLVYGGIKQ
jgi:SAM-dependent methyltransferase